MSTHISEKLPPVPSLQDRPDVDVSLADRSLSRSPRWPMFVLLVAVLGLTGTVIFLGVQLALSNRSAPPNPKTIAVPYAGDSLWSRWHSWVVQEDGRKKPFESFARETLRTITGREKFEGQDAVAIVVSWLMLYEPDQGASNKAGREMGCDWDNYPFILCDHHELREAIFTEKKASAEKAEDRQLNEEERHGKYVSPADIRQSGALEKLLEKASARREKQGSKAQLPTIESKAEEVAKRLKLYDLVRGGGTVEMPRSGAFNVVQLDRSGRTWFSLRTLEVLQNPPAGTDLTTRQLWTNLMDKRRTANPDDYADKLDQPLPADDLAKVLAAYKETKTAYRSQDREKFEAASTNFLDTVAAVSKEYYPDYPGTTMIDRELWFNRINPFRNAWIVGLLATLILGTSVFLGGRFPLAGRILYVAGLLAYLGALGYATVGFYCRVTISGRPPVSNMYESIIWVAFMTAVFGLILELVYRKGVIALAGALVSTFGFVLADQLPMLFTPNILPLVAVLRSNYWLIIHVLTIVSSYAAFALAWGLGNFNMLTIVLAPHRRDLIKTMSMFCYRAIQIGAVMLFAGTMLGGAWAAESWGRFWGWDPKEVWALIAFLVYMIPLHARYVGWIKDFGLAAVSVCCFAFVVMAWYGVNFVLGAGLHSYGFGAGGNSWVYMAGLLNIDLVCVAGLSYLYREQLSGMFHRSGSGTPESV